MAGYAPATPLCASRPTPWRAPIRRWPTVLSPALVSLKRHLPVPDLFADYYLDQFTLLLKNHNGGQKVQLEVGVSAQPIPVHFSFAEHDHIEGNMDAGRRLAMRDLFDLPDLSAMDDGIANGTHEPAHGEAQPLALFTGPRVDYSLHRLRHYTGTSPQHFQNFVLFTNYQFYIDEFIRLGHAMMDARPTRRAIGRRRLHRLCRAGQCRHAPRRPQCKRRRAGRRAAAPAADAGVPPVRADGTGITMVNIGVGPSNAKTITDHVAVLRPHAWLMLGHCAGLRNTQSLGDYVLAHAYVREDHVLDADLPLWVPIPPLAEIQLALEKAVAEVTGLSGMN